MYKIKGMGAVFSKNFQSALPDKDRAGAKFIY